MKYRKGNHCRIKCLGINVLWGYRKYLYHSYESRGANNYNTKFKGAYICVFFKYLEVFMKIANVDVVTLKEKYNTPLYIYDINHVKNNINKYKLIEFPTPQNNRYQFA